MASRNSIVNQLTEYTFQLKKTTNTKEPPSCANKKFLSFQSYHILESQWAIEIYWKADQSKNILPTSGCHDGKQKFNSQPNTASKFEKNKLVTKGTPILWKWVVFSSFHHFNPIIFCNTYKHERTERQTSIFISHKLVRLRGKTKWLQVLKSKQYLFFKFCLYFIKSSSVPKYLQS